MTYTGGSISIIVEVAFGGDPLDPTTWSWTNISSDLLTPGGGLSPAVTIRKGRPNQGARSVTDVQFLLKNFNGQYTPGLATGAHYPNIKRNLPIRISLSGVGPSDPYERVTAFVYSIVPGWDNSLRMAVVAVGAAGRFRQAQHNNKALNSPMKAQILANTPPPYAYWPLEDGAHATRAASAIPGQDPAPVADVSFAADSSPQGSAPLLMFNSATSGVTGFVPPYAATGLASVAAALKIPTAPISTTELVRMTCSGTAATWLMQIVPGVPDVLHVRAFDNTGVSLLDVSANLDEARIYGDWVFVSLDLVQSGADVNYNGAVIYLDATDVNISGTLAGRTIDVTSAVKVRGTGGLSGASVGHLPFWKDPTFVGFYTSGLAYNLNPITMGLLDTTGARYDQLVASAGWTAFAGADVAPGATVIYMGATPVTSLMAGLAEVEDVDGGIIHDGWTNGAIRHVTRNWMYNQAVALSIAMSAKQLQNPFLPTMDDSRVVTEATVTARDGSSAVYSVDTGEGPYINVETLNLLDDTHLYELAGWHTYNGALGTMRYPKVPINLRRTPELAASWLASVVGARVQVTTTMTQHPPDVVDLLLEGYTERLSSRWWDVELVCSPYAPFVVGVLDDPVLGHLSADSLVLAATWNGSAGTFTTTASTLCSVAAGDYPLDLNIGGQRVTVSACAGGANPQTFTVSVASVNGVSKSHAAGEAVALWQPMRLAL